MGKRDKSKYKRRRRRGILQAIRARKKEKQKVRVWRQCNKLGEAKVRRSEKKYKKERRNPKGMG